MKKKIVIAAISFVLLCVLLMIFVIQNKKDKEARQILDATGIKGGLVVHIGCVDQSQLFFSFNDN